MSSISVSMVDGDVPRRIAFGTAMTEALDKSLDGLMASAAWIAYVVTFLAPWTALAALGWWIVKRMRKPREAELTSSA